MLRYYCPACVEGQHDLCAGRRDPAPGVLGGSECVCQNSSHRPEHPDPYQLWHSAKGDPDRYRKLMIEHGHLVPKSQADGGTA